MGSHLPITYYMSVLKRGQTFIHSSNPLDPLKTPIIYEFKRCFFFYEIHGNYGNRTINGVSGGGEQTRPILKWKADWMLTNSFEFHAKNKNASLFVFNRIKNNIWPVRQLSTLSLPTSSSFSYRCMRIARIESSRVWPSIDILSIVVKRPLIKYDRDSRHIWMCANRGVDLSAIRGHVM